jgi:hypothetical protein
MHALDCSGDLTTPILFSYVYYFDFIFLGFTIYAPLVQLSRILLLVDLKLYISMKLMVEVLVGRLMVRKSL